jgi:hypothetical protein
MSIYDFDIYIYSFHAIKGLSFHEAHDFSTEPPCGKEQDHSSPSWNGRAEPDILYGLIL